MGEGMANQFLTLLRRCIAIVALVAVVAPVAAPAQTVTPAVRAQFDAAQLFFKAGRFDEAANQFAAVCAQGIAVACKNANGAWINYANEQRKMCDSGWGKGNYCLTAHDVFKRVCTSPYTDYREIGCAGQKQLANAARMAPYEAITTPPDSRGCLDINLASVQAVSRCDRMIFVHWCFIKADNAKTGCTYRDGAMGWSTFRTNGDTSDTVDGRASAVYWYECYGGGTTFNTATNGPSVVNFDPKTGWHNVRCADYRGNPVAPVYRSTKRAGGIPYPGL